MTRNKYSRDFKIGAVKQVIEEKKILSKVSKELRITPTMLSKWVYEFKEFGDSAFTGNGNKIKSKDFEVELLKRKLKESEEENEILKKFLTFSKKIQK
jgi:transposase